MKWDWVPGALAAVGLWAVVASGIALHEHTELSQVQRTSSSTNWYCQSPQRMLQFQRDYPSMGLYCR